MKFIEIDTRYGRLKAARVTAEYPHDDDEYVYTEECLLIKTENSEDIPSAFLIRDDVVLSETDLSKSDIAELLIDNALNENDYITEFIDNKDGTVKLTSQTFNEPDDGYITDNELDITDNMQSQMLTIENSVPKNKVFRAVLASIILLTAVGFISAFIPSKDSKNTYLPSSASAQNDDNATMPDQDNHTVTIPENPDFRNVAWGMSKYEVKSLEIAPLIEEGTNSLSYENASVAYKTANILYSFADDKLYSATYFFNVSHTNYNRYIDDYDEILSKLTQKYGEPDNSEQKWSDYTYRRSKADWGRAVARGDMFYHSEWENDKTHIVLFLIGESYEVTLVSCYCSNEYASGNNVDDELETYGL